MLAEPHGHERRLVGHLEAFDLQMMLGMTEAGVPCLVGKAGVLGNFLEHALVEIRSLAGHARLELARTPNHAIHEEVEVHRASSSLTPSAPGWIMFRTNVRIISKNRQLARCRARNARCAGARQRRCTGREGASAARRAGEQPLCGMDEADSRERIERRPRYAHDLSAKSDVLHCHA